MESNAFDVDIHFRNKIRLLRYVSSWWTNPSKLWLNLLEKSLSAIRILLMMLASVCQLIQLTKMSNLKGASEIVEVMTLTISACYKSTFFLYYQKDYAALLNLMRGYFCENPLFFRKTQKKYTNMSKFLCYTDAITYLYFTTASIFILFGIIATIFVPETQNSKVLPYCKPNPTLIGCDSLQHNLNSQQLSKSKPNLTLIDCSNVQHNLNPQQLSKSKPNITSINCSNVQHNLNPQQLSKRKPNLTSIDCSSKVQSHHNSSLILKVWLPVDYSWTPFYQIVHLVTSFILFDCCLIYVAQDAFCFTFLYAVCGQFQILEESLMNLDHLARGRLNVAAKRTYSEQGKDVQESIPHHIDGNVDEKLLHKMFGECIQQHILLLKLLRDYEKLMGSMIIIDFLHAICSLSFALLELSVAHTLVHAIKLFCFIAICIVHQYMNNYFGELVIQKQLSISRAVYSLPWEEFPKKIKSSILFMLLRTERPIVINGFKMYLLCYRTFVEFLKAITSYYTVLRSVHLEK